MRLLLPSLLSFAWLLTPMMAAEPAGSSRIARWDGDREAAFCLMFDDGTPTQLRTVLPALDAAGLGATCYINPASGHYRGLQAEWERALRASAVELGNHTMSHRGITGLEHGRRELGGCSDYILKLRPGSPLLSYAKPGGLKPEQWTISQAEHESLLAEHHLVQRPTFHEHGAGIHIHDAEQAMQLVAQARRDGGYEYLIFHGVGGDWLSFPGEQFTRLVEALTAVSDAVWIAGHAAIHKYATERDAATLRVLESGPSQIRIELTVETDPRLYDQALSVVSVVPADWTAVRVVQGATQHEQPVVDGRTCYHVTPRSGEITLLPVPR